VTGGTRGIGLAITQQLKAAGYKVAALYAGNEAAAEAVRKDLGVLCIKADVGDFEAVGAAFAEIEKTLGPIEVLVNNAGITRDGMLHKLTPGQWSEVIRADLDSVFNTSRHVIDGMRDRNFGRIINISSINGQKGQMGQTNYSAAKAGVIGFTKALAQETARKGITVNVIAPGYIDTDMVAAVPEKALEGIIASIPVGRLGKAEEIAGAVLYLASDGAAFVTGSTLTINGGQYIAG
jgi:acetoacetyl-CoA reductase